MGGRGQASFKLFSLKGIDLFNEPNSWATVNGVTGQQRWYNYANAAI